MVFLLSVPVEPSLTGDLHAQGNYQENETKLLRLVNVY